MAPRHLAGSLLRCISFALLGMVAYCAWVSRACPHPAARSIILCRGCCQGQLQAVQHAGALAGQHRVLRVLPGRLVLRCLSTHLQCCERALLDQEEYAEHLLNSPECIERAVEQQLLCFTRCGKPSKLVHNAQAFELIKGLCWTQCLGSMGAGAPASCCKDTPEAC